MARSFTARFFAALGAGVAIALLIAPFAAYLLAHSSLRFPFPRIFDRVVMVALAIVLIVSARSLGLLPLLRKGFARPMGNLPQVGRGLLISVTVMVLLVVIAAAINGIGNWTTAARTLPKYIVAALLIAVIEEGF